MATHAGLSDGIYHDTKIIFSYVCYGTELLNLDVAQVLLLH